MKWVQPQIFNFAINAEASGMLGWQLEMIDYLYIVNIYVFNVKYNLCLCMQIERGSNADLPREGLFCIRKNRCLDPPKPPPSWNQ